MWWQQSLWKLPPTYTDNPDGSGGLRYWMDEMAKWASIMLKLGSVRLELFRTDSAKTEHQKGGEQGIGFKHLAFEVPRLEPAIEALRADGIEPDPIIDMGQLIPRLSDRLLS